MKTKNYRVVLGDGRLSILQLDPPVKLLLTVGPPGTFTVECEDREIGTITLAEEAHPPFRGHSPDGESFLGSSLVDLAWELYEYDWRKEE